MKLKTFKKNHSFRKPWAPEEIAILKAKFADCYTKELCDLFGYDYSKVANMADKLGLKKSDAFRKMELKKQADRLRIVGAGKRFVKGSVPSNKGEKMSDEMREKVKHTFFTPGHKPVNTKYDGHERTDKDGYVLVRVALGKYKFKHRVIWGNANGEIPSGHCLIFKDGNKQNTKLENLELITRAENLRRNRMDKLKKPIAA